VQHSKLGNAPPTSQHVAASERVRSSGCLGSSKERLVKELLLLLLLHCTE
jgi:hypothetical protein